MPPVDSSTPYFSLSHSSRISADQVVNYLANYDPNLDPDHFMATIQNGQTIFNNANSDTIRLMRQVGSGLVTDGVLAHTMLSSGMRAIDKRGYYKILGESNLTTTTDPQGRTYPTYRAPVMFCAGPGSSHYIDIMNVGPLINNTGFGFNLRSSSELCAYNKSTRTQDKIDFLNNLIDKVFYVSDQIWTQDPEFNTRSKHTVWLVLPQSFFFYIDYCTEEIPGTERIHVNRVTI